MHKEQKKANDHSITQHAGKNGNHNVV